MTAHAERMLRRHDVHCPRQHHTYAALALCIWDDAQEVAGEGQYALVSSFTGRPQQVTLWPWIDDALDAKNALDRAAGVDGFAVDNTIHRLTLAAAEVTA